MERTNANISVINGAAAQNPAFPVITEKTTLGELLEILGDIKRLEKTPTVKKLREEAGDPVAVEERTKVYANGYAAYDNGYARTVVWLPYCKSFTYYFNPLKETEKGYGIEETFALPEGLLESQPWPIAVTLIAEHRIETLTMQRKADRKQNKTLIRGDNEEGDAQDDIKEREDPLEKEYTWKGERFGENPETAYIRKEELQTALNNMTEKQREAFILYYKYGYKQEEIALHLGMSQVGVKHHLDGAVKKIKKNIF